MNSPAVQRIEMIRPDDWHLHVRDGDMLKAVMGATARSFGRAIIMPNLRPPMRTVEDARPYRERILAALPADSNFEPLMTLYRTETTRADDIRQAAGSELDPAVKYHPAVPSAAKD